MKKLMKMGCLGFIGIIVLLGIIGAILGNDEESSNSTKPKDQNETIKNEEKTALIGEELKVGDVVFKVNGVSTTTEINDGQFIKYTPDNDGAIFYLVDITVKNAGKTAITTDSSFFELHKDDVKYSPSRIIAVSSGYFNYEGINPGLSQTGKVIFEVPQNETGYVLQVQTGFFGTEKGEISLN